MHQNAIWSALLALITVPLPAWGGNCVRPGDSVFADSFEVAEGNVYYVAKLADLASAELSRILREANSPLHDPNMKDLQGSSPTRESVV